MDIKTLEYMSEKVEKGRNLKAEIINYENRVEKLEHNIVHCVDFSVGSYSCGAKATDSKIVKAIVRTAIDLFKEKIAQLEQEFAEL